MEIFGQSESLLGDAKVPADYAMTWTTVVWILVDKKRANRRCFTRCTIYWRVCGLVSWSCCFAVIPVYIVQFVCWPVTANDKVWSADTACRRLCSMSTGLRVVNSGHVFAFHRHSALARQNLRPVWIRVSLSFVLIIIGLSRGASKITCLLDLCGSYGAHVH